MNNNKKNMLQFFKIQFFQFH